MTKVKFPAAALLLLMLIGIAPLTASAPLSASAATVTESIKVKSMDVKMIFDGVNMQPPTGQYVFIYNNATYVPLRFVSYALQKSVSWDAKNVKVTVAEPSTSELVVIKEYLMNAVNGNSAAAANKNIVLSKVKASYVFNGSAKAVPTGQGSYILNGSLYVPLRFLSESVGNSISWDQKTKTITAESAAYQAQPTPDASGNTSGSSATATPTPSSSAAAGGGAGSGTLTYEQITSDTEAKLSALQSQSTSTLMSIGFEYIAATDEATKASLMAKGKQQLASFTASFNSIIAEAEQKLNANGYSTDIIAQYRAAFEAQLQAGRELAEGMGD
ncbi:copper amine oxidase N-terminal domain-containing protein [Paenibacillus sp. S150]|uniref:copper amine oxidase N-terminal domain-containing protein n=1 Tax=Paenibacillus sp. S150 TaxID=2749826 RepID=UPI001C55E163|nr:copper amine oxidase N-terminal domain-containing protein [Paenibacillus sp. S150]MBW4084524.1 copper amine oxidase N-terminal domain-containing protein [Paenibacillus sp. S150]